MNKEVKVKCSECSHFTWEPPTQDSPYGEMWCRKGHWSGGPNPDDERTCNDFKPEITSMNKESLAEAYALKKWGYEEGTKPLDVAFMDCAVVNNSKEDFLAGYAAAVEEAAPAVPVRLHSSGGITGIHDYEMSDGSIKTLSTAEVSALREEVADMLFVVKSLAEDGSYGVYDAVDEDFKNLRDLAKLIVKGLSTPPKP